MKKKRSRKNSDSEQQTDLSPASRSRRTFIGKVAVVTVAAGIIGAAKKIPVAQEEKVVPQICTTGCDIEVLTPTQRANTQLAKRVNAAIFDRLMGVPSHPCNNDEALYRNENLIGSFTKGLRKTNSFGEVDIAAYCALLKAVRTNSPADFEAIPLGCNPCTPASGDADTTTTYDDSYFTAQGTVPDPRPYANSTESSQVPSGDQQRISGGVEQTPAQDQADQDRAAADQASSVPNG